MSDDVTTAATIASLRAEVDRLKAELQGEREDLAACYKAKATLIDERNACLRELDFARAENVRLSNEAADLRGQMEMLLKEVDECQSWIGGQDVRSDFQTATAMRQALDRERERVREWNVLVAQGCTPGGSEFHDCPQNVARYIKSSTEDKDNLIKSQQKQLNRERERCGVLEAEVKAWHAAEHLRKDEPHNEFMRLAEARARTRETNALDAAKFDQHKRGSIIECLDNVREAGGKAWDNVANPDAVLRGDDDAAKFGGAT